MNRSIKLITVLGIPIDINYSWFIIFFLVVYSLASSYFPLVAPEYNKITHLLMALIAAIFLFICLLLHELSHSFIAKTNRLPISGITLFVFGGVAHMEKEPDNPGVEFKMAAAGPLMSIFLGGCFWFLSSLLFIAGAPGFIFAITNYLSFLNFAVAIFNLIPGFPLDGGRLFRAAIWHFSGNLRQATFIASAIGKFFAAVMAAFGLFGLFVGSFLTGIWFIFLGIFLMEAAELSYKNIRFSIEG